MSGSVARHTLNTARHINKLLCFGAAFIEGFKLRRDFERAVNGNFQFVRYLLCNGIHCRIRQAENTANVAYRRARRKSSERYYLRHVVISVFLDNIIYDLLTSDIAKVNVKVGHTDPFGIEKTLKQQVIFHRVNSGYADAVGRKARRS